MRAWRSQLKQKETATKKLTVLLPAYNEEQAIGKVIDEIREYADCEVIVVDNASVDQTATIALSRSGVTVIREPRKGKGYAIRTGLSRIETPFVIMMDSDYTYPAEYLPAIMRRLEQDTDVVITNRAEKDVSEAIGRINTLGNKALSLLAKTLYGYPVNDICSGMWGFRREILGRFDLTSPGFTLEADLFVNTVRRTKRIKRVPITYRARLDGSTSKLRVKDGLKIGWFLVRNRLERKIVTVVVAGKFDPLLRGHLDHIQKARALGDRLVVITHPDSVVAEARRKEGKIAKCLIPLEDRVAVLQNLKWVDDVVVSIDGDGGSDKTLEMLRPDVFAKGGDRTPDNMPRDEVEVCERLGIKIVYGVGDLLTSSSAVVAGATQDYPSS